MDNLLNTKAIKDAGGRDLAMDILKGFGIILVLVAHSLGGYIHTFAYSFHMPLFFLLSGYFFKPRVLLTAFKLDFQRLMVPFFFTCILMLSISSCLFSLGVENIKTPEYLLEALIYGNGSSVNHHKIWGNWGVVGSVWFLPALFWARITFNLIQNRWPSKSMIIIILLGGCAALAGQYILLPYSALQGLTALPFLLIGYEVKKSGGVAVIIKKIKSSTPMLLLTICFIILWCISTSFKCLDMAQFCWALYYYPNIVLAVAGVFVFYNISYYISMHTNKIASFLAFLGKYSIILVCFPVVETYVIPLNDIIPDLAMKKIILIGCKVLWCIIAMIMTLKTPFFRKIFSIK